MVHLDVKALQILFRQFFRRIRLGIEQRGHQRDCPRAKTLASHLVTQFAHFQRGRQSIILLPRHPLRFARGLEPAHALIVLAQACQPLRFGFALAMALAKLGRVLAMRPKADDLLLMHAEDRMPVFRGKKGDLRVGAAAAIVNQHITFLEFRMQFGDLRRLVRAQRQGQRPDDKTRRVAQRQQRRHRKPHALDLLRLTEMFLKRGCVGHGEAGGVGAPHAMAAPAARFIRFGP